MIFLTGYINSPLIDAASKIDEAAHLSVAPLVTHPGNEPRHLMEFQTVEISLTDVNVTQPCVIVSQQNKHRPASDENVKRGLEQTL